MTWGGGIHRDELRDNIMRKLIDEQFPWLARRELGRRYTLEDHLSVRIGDDYGAVFPRFAQYDPLYARAADLLRPLAGQWHFYASYPIATGVPAHGFPYHWVIVEWNSVSTAGFVPLNGDSAFTLGKAIREIHVPSAAHAPLNPLTGVGLEKLSGEFDHALNFAQTTGTDNELNMAETRAVFAEGIRADRAYTPTWTHGRLEPRAVLSDCGKFGGILLWHNFGAGDPAADLGYAANLLPLAQHPDLWSGYGNIDDRAAARAQAYQVYAALRYMQSDDPFLLRMAWDRLKELELARAT